MKNKLTTEWEFAIGQKVKIAAIEIDAVVLSRLDDGSDFMQYKVAWFANCQRYEAWLEGYELLAKE